MIKSKHGCTRLGLTKIVELLGEKLAVECKEYDGTNFYFTLMLQKDKENKYKTYPNVSDVKVGLDLPVWCRAIKQRQREIK